MSKLIRFLIVVPVLKVTGYRFNKSHRVNESFMYLLFNTTLANIEAE